MADPGSSKSARQDGGKPTSGIGARGPSQRPLAGAQAIPTRSPKAPLPPRVSLPDNLELGEKSAPAPIEPESFHEADAPAATLAMPSPISPMSPMSPIAPPASLLSPIEPADDDDLGTLAMPNAFQNALAQLQQRSPQGAAGTAPASGRREVNGAEAKRTSQPPPFTDTVPNIKDLGKDLLRPASVPTEMMGSPVMAPVTLHTPTKPPQAPSSAPGSAGGLAPKTGPNPITPTSTRPGSLAPARTPSPMAIVGGSSLRLNTDAPPKTMPFPSSPPPMKSVAPPAANAPLVGKGPLTAKTSVPPPAGGPAVQYERAFRQWSVSTPPDAASVAPSGPVSFEVYTAADLRARQPMRSRAAFPVEKKSNIGLRILAVLIGGAVVAATAAAVLAVSSEEPRRDRVAVSKVPAPATATSEAPPPTTPTAIVIGDGVDDGKPAAAAASAAASASPTAPSIGLTAAPVASAVTPVTKPRVRTAPRPPASTASDAPGRGTGAAAPGGASATPASLRNVAPPPNPYGN